jgi:hypothetical protein
MKLEEYSIGVVGVVGDEPTFLGLLGFTCCLAFGREEA